MLFFSVQTRIGSAAGFVTSLRASSSREIKIHIGALLKLAELEVIQSKMPHCAVPLCTNGSRKTKGMDISYHRLPNGPLGDIWLRNLRRTNPRDRGHTYVCCAHFTPDCFEANTGLIPGFKNRKTLKPMAIPTIFSFPTKSNVNKPRLSSVKQIKSREKRFEIFKFFLNFTVWYFINYLLQTQCF